MGKYVSSETKAFLRLVLMTFGVLAALAVTNIFIIFNSLGTPLLKPLKRNIAAVASPTPTVEPILHSPPIIDLDCKNSDSKISINTQATNARFTFKNCKTVSRLFNEANRNQGDVFQIEKNQWTSDYLSLAPGANSILITMDSKKHRFEIKRMPTEKKPKP